MAEGDSARTVKAPQAPSQEDYYKRGHSYPGIFLVFEGADGSGKSTQYSLFTQKIDSLGFDRIAIREPGGTEIGERIRGILLDPIHNEMALETELLLYNASRAQIVEQVIRPALREGKIVTADRYDKSTVAYQGVAGGLPLGVVMPVISVATRGLRPDRTYIYDVSPEVAAKRLNPILDRIESKGLTFHEKVRSGYVGLSYLEPESTLLINTDVDSPEVIAQKTWDDFSSKFLADSSLVSRLKRK